MTISNTVCQPMILGTVCYALHSNLLKGKRFTLSWSLTVLQYISHLRGAALSLLIRSLCVILSIFSSAPQSTNSCADLTFQVQQSKLLEASWLENNAYPAGSDWHLSVIKSSLSITGDILETSSWMLESYSTNLQRK